MTEQPQECPQICVYGVPPASGGGGGAWMVQALSPQVMCVPLQAIPAQIRRQGPVLSQIIWRPAQAPSAQSISHWLAPTQVMVPVHSPAAQESFTGAPCASSVVGHPPSHDVTHSGS
jgi:hypothetical protein